MNCSKCGAPIPEGSALQFCGSCGARLPLQEGAPGGVGGQIPRGLRAMDVGQILDETIRLFRQNFRTFIGIVAVLQVPLVILQMIPLAIAGPSLFDFSTIATASQFPIGPFLFLMASTFALGIVGLFVFVIVQAGLVSAISQRYLGGQVTVGGAYRVARSCFWRVLGTTLLIGIFLGVLAVTIVGIPLSIFFAIRYSFAVPAVVVEGAGIRKALSRSSGLVKGSWWRVLGVLVLAAIVQYLAASVPTWLIAAGLPGIGLTMGAGNLLPFLIISTAVGAVFGILSAPLVPTINTLLYYDLRIRKEGFDLEVMAGRPAVA